MLSTYERIKTSLEPQLELKNKIKKSETKVGVQSRKRTVENGSASTVVAGIKNLLLLMDVVVL